MSERMIPEARLLELLSGCIKLFGVLLPALKEHGTKPVPSALLAEYESLLATLQTERRRESILADESWLWIWNTPAQVNHLQLYGRLAWIHYNIFDLL